MRRNLTKHLVCPRCGSCGEFVLEVFDMQGQHVKTGRTVCKGCLAWFRIENTILDLAPEVLVGSEPKRLFASKYGLEYVPVSFPGITGQEEKTRQMEFFRRDAQKYDREITQNPCFIALDRLLVESWLGVAKASAGNALDLGCGTGRQIIRLVDSGYSVTGVDLSEHMLERAVASLTEQGKLDAVDLIVCDVEDLPLHSYYDVCLCIGTLHHLPDRCRAVESACGALSEGGRILFYDPNQTPLRGVFDLMMKAWRLYDEQASEGAPVCQASMKEWLGRCGVNYSIRSSVFLPPHLFSMTGYRIGEVLLRTTDAICSCLPVARNWGGILVSTGQKSIAGTHV